MFDIFYEDDIFLKLEISNKSKNIYSRMLSEYLLIMCLVQQFFIQNQKCYKYK